MCIFNVAGQFKDKLARHVKLHLYSIVETVWVTVLLSCYAHNPCDSESAGTRYTTLYKYL